MLWFLADSNVGMSYNNAVCSNSTTCQPTTSSHDAFLLSLFSPVYQEINPCCGLSDEADYYSLDGGPCQPCKSFSQVTT